MSVRPVEAQDPPSRPCGLGPEALLFTSPEGHPLRRTKFQLRWLVASKEAGVSGLHFHDLRGSGRHMGGHGRRNGARADDPVRTHGARRSPPLPARHSRAGPSDRQHSRSSSTGRRCHHRAQRRNRTDRLPPGLGRPKVLAHSGDSSQATHSVTSTALRCHVTAGVPPITGAG